ncbi:MAG: LacI family DNA-binding transcriptional regulator [Ktedonobacteraceae bacterium]
MTAKLTIRDIARLAGVSKSTASRVLNAHPKVEPETRERILTVMKEQGFIPNAAATGLAKGHNRLIGLLVPALTWELVTDVLQGVATVVEDTQYEIILYCASPGKDFTQVIDRMLATNMAIGLLALLHTQSPQHLVELHEQGFPIVLINHVATRVDLPQVGIDNVDSSLVLEGDYTCEGGYQCAQKFFALAEPPTAIFASNDLTAYGVLQAAEEYGVHIPEDVALVGFDDIPPSIHVQPGLTTVHQPFKEMGQKATELLLSLINQNQTFSDQHDLPDATVRRQDAPLPHIVLPTQLIVRKSCGAALTFSKQSA